MNAQTETVYSKVIPYVGLGYALEKAKTEKEAHGEFEKTSDPGNVFQITRQFGASGNLIPVFVPRHAATAARTRA
jgi:hypothetical protein